MIRKAPQPPTARRVFGNSWDELNYLCDRVRYWLHVRKRRASAERYRDRLQRVIDSLPKSDDAIIRHEALGLLADLDGDLGAAITHRRKEIALMERLLTEAADPRYGDRTRLYMLRGRNAVALRQRRSILGRLEQEVARRNGASGRR